MAILPARAASASRASRTCGLLVLAAMTAGAIGLSCSESETPLGWDDAVRGGLGNPRGVVSSAAVEISAHDSAAVTTGPASRLLVGKFERQGTAYTARTFLRWDLETGPQGTVTSASLSLMISSLELADEGETGPFEIRLYRVTGDWQEDSLTLLPLPPVDLGAPIADELIDISGLDSSSGVLARANLFKDDPDLIDLVSDWLADSTSNYGVMLRASSSSPSGVLRCFSRTATHPSLGTALATPLLAVEVDTSTAPTSLEAVADAYVVGPLSPPAALPESLLLVGSGYVQRVAFHIDPLPLLAIPTLPESPEVALLRGVLRLHLVPGNDWSLPPGKTLTIKAYGAEIDWAAANPIRGATFIESLGEATLAGEDSTVEFTIAGHLRDRIEGGERSVVVICVPEVGQIGSVLFKSRVARSGPPEVEAAFGPLGDRQGR